MWMTHQQSRQFCHIYIKYDCKAASLIICADCSFPHPTGLPRKSKHFLRYPTQGRQRLNDIAISLHHGELHFPDGIRKFFAPLLLRQALTAFSTLPLLAEGQYDKEILRFYGIDHIGFYGLTGEDGTCSSCKTDHHRTLRFVKNFAS
jgi:hypothetical protein